MKFTDIFSAKEFTEVVTEHSSEIVQAVTEATGGGPVNISVPADGKGLRVKVSVLPAHVRKVPSTLRVAHKGAKYYLLTEPTGDYQKMEPQAPPSV